MDTSVKLKDLEKYYSLCSEYQDEIQKSRYYKFSRIADKYMQLAKNISPKKNSKSEQLLRKSENRKKELLSYIRKNISNTKDDEVCEKDISALINHSLGNLRDPGFTCELNDIDGVLPADNEAYLNMEEPCLDETIPVSELHSWNIFKKLKGGKRGRPKKFIDVGIKEEKGRKRGRPKKFIDVGIKEEKERKRGRPKKFIDVGIKEEKAVQSSSFNNTKNIKVDSRKKEQSLFKKTFNKNFTFVNNEASDRVLRSRTKVEKLQQEIKDTKSKNISNFQNIEANDERIKQSNNDLKIADNEFDRTLRNRVKNRSTFFNSLQLHEQPAEHGTKGRAQEIVKDIGNRYKNDVTKLGVRHVENSRSEFKKKVKLKEYSPLNNIPTVEQDRQKSCKLSNISSQVYDRDDLVKSFLKDRSTKRRKLRSDLNDKDLMVNIFSEKSSLKTKKLHSDKASKTIIKKVSEEKLLDEEQFKCLAMKETLQKVIYTPCKENKTLHTELFYPTSKESKNDINTSLKTSNDYSPIFITNISKNTKRMSKKLILLQDYSLHCVSSTNKRKYPDILDWMPLEVTDKKRMITDISDAKTQTRKSIKKKNILLKPCSSIVPMDSLNSVRNDESSFKNFQSPEKAVVPETLSSFKPSERIYVPETSSSIKMPEKRSVPDTSKNTKTPDRIPVPGTSKNNNTPERTYVPDKSMSINVHDNACNILLPDTPANSSSESVALHTSNIRNILKPTSRLSNILEEKSPDPLIDQRSPASKVVSRNHINVEGKISDLLNTRASRTSVTEIKKSIDDFKIVKLNKSKSLNKAKTLSHPTNAKPFVSNKMNDTLLSVIDDNYKKVNTEKQDMSEICNLSLKHKRKYDDVCNQNSETSLQSSVCSGKQPDTSSFKVPVSKQEYMLSKLKLKTVKDGKPGALKNNSALMCLTGNSFSVNQSLGYSCSFKLPLTLEQKVNKFLRNIPSDSNVTNDISTSQNKIISSPKSSKLCHISSNAGKNIENSVLSERLHNSPNSKIKQSQKNEKPKEINTIDASYHSFTTSTDVESLNTHTLNNISFSQFKKLSTSLKEEIRQREEGQNGTLIDDDYNTLCQSSWKSMMKYNSSYSFANRTFANSSFRPNKNASSLVISHLKNMVTNSAKPAR